MVPCWTSAGKNPFRLSYFALFRTIDDSEATSEDFVTFYKGRRSILKLSKTILTVGSDPPVCLVQKRSMLRNACVLEVLGKDSNWLSPIFLNIAGRTCFKTFQQF